jgi:hypothetical protein
MWSLSKYKKKRKMGVKDWLLASLLITHQGPGVRMDLRTTGVPTTSPYFMKDDPNRTSGLVVAASIFLRTKQASAFRRALRKT